VATSRDSSNGPDWQDLTAAVTALEEMHVARIELRTSRKGRGDGAWLIVTAEGYPYQVGRVERRHSVSVSAPIHTAGSVMAVATMYRLLLTLDFEMSREWAQKMPV